MKYIDIVRTANSNLRKSKLRTFLTVVAVFIGAFTITMTNGVGDGVKSYVNVQLGNVGAKDSLFVVPRDQAAEASETNNGLTEYNPDRKKTTNMGEGPQGSTLMNEKDVATIAKIEGVKEVVKTYMISPEYVTAGKKKFETMVGQYVDGFLIDMQAGTLPDNSSATDITLPYNYLEPLGLGTDAAAVVGKTVTFGFKTPSGKLFEEQARIVGVQRQSLIGGSGINMSSRLVKKIYDQQTAGLAGLRGTYGYLIARFDNEISESEQDALKYRFEASGFEARTISDQLGIVNKVLNTVTIALNIFGGIALLAASFGIINTLFMAVQERTREIGLMKALGMNKNKIFLLFSLEAVLIGFWGSLLGILAANGAGRIINSYASDHFLKDFEGFNLLAFPLRSMVLVMMLIIAIAFLAGTLPARRASKKDPIEALRYE
jgi:putative ABC transport system permease protein